MRCFDPKVALSKCRTDAILVNSEVRQNYLVMNHWKDQPELTSLTWYMSFVKQRKVNWSGGLLVLKQHFVLQGFCLTGKPTLIIWANFSSKCAYFKPHVSANGFEPESACFNAQIFQFPKQYYWGFKAINYHSDISDLLQSATRSQRRVFVQYLTPVFHANFIAKKERQRR